MDGPKKSVRFGFMRKGEYIGASAVLNMHTKFAKLAVGKHVITAKHRHSTQDPLFPLAIALNGLHPLTKVWVDYEPMPRNTFKIRVNDEDIYSLIKEEVDYDPTKTETLNVKLEVNDKEVIFGAMPWIIDDVEDRIQTVLGMNYLTSLNIQNLKSKSWVANEFLDVLTCYDLPEQGLSKLIFKNFDKLCEPFEDEVITRLANMCTHLNHLQMNDDMG